jgi:hypothetical protein
VKCAAIEWLLCLHSEGLGNQARCIGLCMTWLTYHLLHTYSSHNYTVLVTTPLNSWCHIPERRFTGSHTSRKSSDIITVDWLNGNLLFYFPLKNISLIWRRHHYRWRAENFLGLCSALRTFEQGRISLSCHTCCDTGPQFFLSHPKERPILSPFMTHEGIWRIYSTTDPYGPHSVTSYDTQGDVGTFSNPDPHGL